jgi:hypothetical protein
VLKEYFPLFNREKIIRELEVFHFQERGRPLREFIKEVADAAEFLQYCASEGDGGKDFDESSPGNIRSGCLFTKANMT